MGNPRADRRTVGFTIPDHFSLLKTGTEWTFHNRLLREKHSFTFGDEATLPLEPLDFIGRHVQEDVILMMQRDGDLYLDGGSCVFLRIGPLPSIRDEFQEIHHPIPGFKEEGLDQRISTFLMRMEAGDPWVRRNWSLMAGDRLDSSLETFDEWGKGRTEVTDENVGKFVHMRVEVQKLFRLPGSNAILFTIHTHLLSLEALSANQVRRNQFLHILEELPDEIATYKGITLFKDKVIHYLRKSR